MELERFLRRVLVEPEAGCWVWQGGQFMSGYGAFYLGKRRHIRAHRWAYEYYIGPVPPDMELDHLCRVLLCVNPAHLEPVDHHTNLLRGHSPAALNARKAACIHGHEFTDANTRIRSGRGRECRECRRALQRAYRARVRSEHCG